MKRAAAAAMLAALVFLLSGCGRTRYPDLPADAEGFTMGEYIDRNDDDAAYGTIEYAGRLYMPYGTISKTVRGEDVEACVGYLIQDGAADTDERVYTLKDDPDRNYLMQYYIGTTLMNQPMFWRAVDTRGQEIHTPAYIMSLSYAYWETYENYDSDGR